MFIIRGFLQWGKVEKKINSGISAAVSLLKKSFLVKSEEFGRLCNNLRKWYRLRRWI